MAGRGASRVPERWTDYIPLGCRMPGTRFIAFKVPLKKSFDQNLLPEERFSPHDLIRRVEERQEELGLVIDLTCTTRYYGREELPPTLRYSKILTMGHEIPNRKTILRFKYLVKKFLTHNKDNDKLIGVHCTHGLNRTGYLVCRYLIDVEGMEPNAAIELFNKSRGHPIERTNYIQDLQRRALKNSCELKNSGSDLGRKKGSAPARPQKQLVKHHQSQAPLAVPRNPKKKQRPDPTAQGQPRELGHRHRALGQGQLQQKQFEELQQGQLEQRQFEKLEQRQQKHLEQRQLEQKKLERRQQKKLEQKQQKKLEQKQQKKLEQKQHNHLEQRQQKKLKHLEQRQNHLEQKQQRQQNYLEQRQNHLEQNHLEQRQLEKQNRLEQRQQKKLKHLEQNHLEQRQNHHPDQNHLEQRQLEKQNHLEQRQNHREHYHLEQNHLEQRQQKKLKHLEQNHLEQKQNHLEQKQQKKLNHLEQNHLEQKQQRQQNSLEQKQHNHPEQRQQKKLKHLEQNHLEQEQQRQLEKQNHLEQRQQNSLEQRQPCSSSLAPRNCWLSPAPKKKHKELFPAQSPQPWLPQEPPRARKRRHRKHELKEQEMS